MEPEDFLFEQQGFGYGDDAVPRPRWWDVRARWSLMSGGHRTNVVLYALSAVSLALLMFEVTSGENNPDLQVAGQVLPVASSTTSTSRPARVTTTSKPPTSTSSTVASTSRPTVAATTGTTRRATAPAGQTTPAATEDTAPPATDPAPTPTNPPQQTPTPTPTSPAPTSAPTTQPPDTTPPDTTPPDTSPPVTLSDRACELLAERGRTFPGCP